MHSVCMLSSPLWTHTHTHRPSPMVYQDWFLAQRDAAQRRKASLEGARRRAAGAGGAGAGEDGAGDLSVDQFMDLVDVASVEVGLSFSVTDQRQAAGGGGAGAIELFRGGPLGGCRHRLNPGPGPAQVFLGYASTKPQYPYLHGLGIHRGCTSMGFPAVALPEIFYPGSARLPRNNLNPHPPSPPGEDRPGQQRHRAGPGAPPRQGAAGMVPQARAGGRRRRRRHGVGRCGGRGAQAPDRGGLRRSVHGVCQAGRTGGWGGRRRLGRRRLSR